MPSRPFPTTRSADADVSSSRFVLARMQTAAHAPASHYFHVREMTWLAPGATGGSAPGAPDQRPD
jgi:hypothetical protein